jgi:hypothetical protein
VTLNGGTGPTFSEAIALDLGLVAHMQPQKIEAAF